MSQKRNKANYFALVFYGDFINPVIFSNLQITECTQAKKPGHGECYLLMKVAKRSYSSAVEKAIATFNKSTNDLKIPQIIPIDMPLHGRVITFDGGPSRKTHYVTLTINKIIAENGKHWKWTSNNPNTPDLRAHIARVEGIEDQLNAAEPSGPGTVYAAWNPLWPDLVRFGVTRNNVKQHVRQLSDCNTTIPYYVVDTLDISDPNTLQAQLSSAFSEQGTEGDKKQYVRVSCKSVCKLFDDMRSSIEAIQ
jgi:hypothetical protein